MTSPAVPRYNVLGVGISAVDYAGVTKSIIDAAKCGARLGVSALAVHAVMEAQSSPDYRLTLNSLDISTPDGQPVRWAMNTLYEAGIRERVYGPYLMRDVCAAAASADLPIFLFGSTSTILENLSRNLRAAYPGLRIAGTQASRFRIINENEAHGDARAIAESGAKLVFCGLGCPRQESWVHAMRPLIGVPIIGVGAAFALWAGERSMAPSWMQDNGLEWLYRLRQEPGRLAGRYLLQGPGFFAKLAFQKMGLQQADISPKPVSPVYWG